MMDSNVVLVPEQGWHCLHLGEFYVGLQLPLDELFRRLQL
jgi:hypothetical protein